MYVPIFLIISFTFIFIYIFNHINKFKPSYDENKILNISKINNKDRHLNNEKEYAHFSEVVSKTPNIFNQPLYYLSHPTEYRVNKGQFLYIPKHWWHWVVSFSNSSGKNICFAYNYWFDESLNNEQPFIGKHANEKDCNNMVDELYKKIKQENFKVDLWNHKADNNTKQTTTTTLKSFLNDDKYNDCYMITLKAYNSIENNIKNNNFFDEFSKHIKKPNKINNKKIKETNFWLNKGNMDTGLHYDDYDGVLCIIEGYKIVTLFPPSDTKFLYAL